MKNYILLLVATILFSSAFTQKQCDTCYDVSGNVSALAFIDSNTLAVAGEFDSLVKLDFSIYSWAVLADSALPKTKISGVIKNAQTTENGAIYCWGNLYLNSEKGNVAFIANNQPAEILKVDNLGSYKRVIDNRLYFLRGNQLVRTKKNSIELDSVFNQNQVQIKHIQSLESISDSLYLSGWAVVNGADTRGVFKLDTVQFNITTVAIPQLITTTLYPVRTIREIDTNVIWLGCEPTALNGITTTSAHPNLLINRNGDVLRSEDSILNSSVANFHEVLFDSNSHLFNGMVYWFKELESTGTYSITLYKDSANGFGITDSLVLPDFEFVNPSSNTQMYFKSGMFIDTSRSKFIPQLADTADILIVTADFSQYKFHTQFFDQEKGLAKFKITDSQILSIKKNLRTKISPVDNLMFYNISTNTVDSSHAINGAVHALWSNQSHLFVGGLFDSVNHQPANNFAIYNFSQNTWDLTSIQSEGVIKDVVNINDTLWIGGRFDTSQINTLGNLKAFKLPNLQPITLDTFSAYRVDNIGVNKHQIWIQYRKDKPYVRKFMRYLNRNGLSEVQPSPANLKSFLPYRLTDLSKNISSSLQTIGGYSPLISDWEPSFTSYNSKLNHTAATGLAFNDCDPVDYDDAFYSSTRINSVGSYKHLSILNPGANYAVSRLKKSSSYNWQNSREAFLAYPDNQLIPLIPLLRKNISGRCSFKPSSTAVNDYFIANGIHIIYSSDPEQEMRIAGGIRFLSIYTMPKLRSAFSGSIDNISLCESEDSLQLYFQFYPGNDQTSPFLSIESGQQLIGSSGYTFTPIGNNTYELLIEEFQDFGTLKLEFGIQDSIEVIHSQTFSIDVLETPETPVLSLINGEVVGDQMAYPYTWLTEQGEYLGWNLPYLPIDPNYNLYSAYVTHQNGCKSALSNVLVVSGISPQTSDHRFNLIPNPADERIQISNADFVQQVSAITLSGQPVELNMSNTGVVDCSHLTPGMYLVLIEDFSGNTEHHKLIVE